MNVLNFSFIYINLRGLRAREYPTTDPDPMRQSDLRVGATKRRREELIVASAASFICSVSHEVGLAGIKQAIKEDENVQLLNRRTRHI